jgi:putative zinc finger protein
MGCRATEDQLVPMLLGALTPMERADIDRHLFVCAHCAGALRALELAGSAYDEAFATLRSRRARIAPGRARLAAAMEPPVGLGLAVRPHLLGLRLAEAVLALSVVTLVVVGSLGVEPARPTAATPRPALLTGPAMAAPERGDAEMIRAARLKYIETRDMVITVPARTPY